MAQETDESQNIPVIRRRQCTHSASNIVCSARSAMQAGCCCSRCYPSAVTVPPSFSQLSTVSPDKHDTSPLYAAEHSQGTQHSLSMDNAFSPSLKQTSRTTIPPLRCAPPGGRQHTELIRHKWPHTATHRLAESDLSSAGPPFSCPGAATPVHATAANAVPIVRKPEDAAQCTENDLCSA